MNPIIKLSDKAALRIKEIISNADWVDEFNHYKNLILLFNYFL